jgi:hypothetical protein
VVGPRLVVTSAHVVARVGALATVFRPGEDSMYTGHVAWCGTPGGRDDAALVRIDDPAWPPMPGTVPWGRSVTHQDRLRCESAGVPDLVGHDGQPIHTARLTGVLNPGDRMAGDRYVVRLDGPAEPEPEVLWGDLSGAAVFCGDLLAGVVVADPTARQHAALEAVPAYVLHHDPGFREVLAGDSTPHVADQPAVPPIELTGLDDPEAGHGPTGTSPASLLSARDAVVPFHGRAGILADLHTWAARPGTGWWLLHGPSGQGKTRLAHHFGEQLADAGWVVLWLDPSAPATALRSMADTVVPTLVVIDQAEFRIDQLAALSDALRGRRATTPLRIVLTSRTEGPWAHGRATALPVLDATDRTRRNAYTAAVSAFTTALSTMPGMTHAGWAKAAAGLAPTEMPAGSTVLSVQLTALADLLDAAAVTTALPIGPIRDPEDRVLAHERGYWLATAAEQRLVPGTSINALTDVVTAAILLGTPAYDRVPRLALRDGDTRARIGDWLAGLYPSRDGRTAFLGALPGRLTDRLVARLLADRRQVSIVQRLAGGVTGTEATHWVTMSLRAATDPLLGNGMDAVVARLCARHPRYLAPARTAALRGSSVG